MIVGRTPDVFKHLLHLVPLQSDIKFALLTPESRENRKRHGGYEITVWTDPPSGVLQVDS